MAKAIELDEDTRSKLVDLAAQRRQGLDALVRDAVSQFIERENSHAAFRQAALESWAEFQSSGLHATSDEVDDWLARLERGEDAAPPACHG